MSNHFCTTCGAGIDPDAHFCPACGHVLHAEGPAALAAPAAPAASIPPPPPTIPPPPPGTAPAPAPGPPGDGSNQRVLLAVVAGLAVLALLLGGLALAMRDGGSDDGERAATTGSSDATAPGTPTTATTTTTTAPPPTTAVPRPTSPTPPPTSSSPDRSGESILLVQDAIARCAEGSGFDPFEVIMNMFAEQVEPTVWQVEAVIVLDSGGWSALFDVDYANPTDPFIEPLDPDSAQLIHNCG